MAELAREKVSQLEIQITQLARLCDSSKLTIREWDLRLKRMPKGGHARLLESLPRGINHRVIKRPGENHEDVNLHLDTGNAMLVNCQTATQSAGQNQHHGATDLHSSAVDTQGDHAMGFSHETSTHHFRLLSDGGAIEVTASDPNDKVTRDEIKNHLSHIVQMFTNGNFEIPMFIHDRVPPGVLVMKAKHASINYVFEQMPSGGRVRITTTYTKSLKAVHQFLTFQVDDHRTGDPKLPVSKLALHCSRSRLQLQS